MKWLKKNITTILLSVVFLAGLCLLLYPTVSDYWNKYHQSRAIASYATAVAAISNDDYAQKWDEAVQYNRHLLETGGVRWKLSEEEEKEYKKVLDITGTGIMAYIEIPAINCSFPVYHSTDEAVLQIAIGHLEGSSLPVGGEGTHCILSGHRGLPSARLFTDIDKLVEGDTFLIRTLDDTLTYEVDQILIVLPYELDSLMIEPDKDLCTLVTCTPYGVNSHRLLVRGHRVETVREKAVIRVTADAQQIEPMVVAPIVAVPILLIFLILTLIPKRRKETQKRGG